MSAPEIPDAVSWAETMAFVNRIGLEAKSLRSLELGADGVWATIMAKSAEGQIVVADGDAACHRMFIPYDRTSVPS